MIYKLFITAVILFGLNSFTFCFENSFKKTPKEHPFLIVRKDQYEALRAKANYEPWKSMKADAILRSENGKDFNVPKVTYKMEVETKLQYYIGAAALAFILDEDNALIHARRVKDVIVNDYSKLNPNEVSDWGGVTPPMGSLFIAILSLDIVYDALTPKEIKVCEDVISSQLAKVNREGSWAGVRLGTHGTWDIYKGVRTSPDSTYYEKVINQITEDGVSSVTNHYAWERLGGGDRRASKSGYMDVLEFTGIDRRYYNNEKLKKFYRWLYGSSVNCSKEMAIFGDMIPTYDVENSLLHRRIVNFDSEAAGYAAWVLKDIPAIGHILTYILPQKPLPEPVVPSSKSYDNGGAFFREKGDNPKGLHGVLYNIKSQDEWHTHNEVNALALSGFGNRLLINGGRLGPPARPAYLNNTLTINGENHNSRLGGGIVESIITDEFDYACGFSGSALVNAKHYRSLLLIHASNKTSPYFVVFDEVETDKKNEIRNFVHVLNKSGAKTVSDGEVYVADIDYFPTVEGTLLTTFFATPSDKLIVEKSPSNAGRYPDHPDHCKFEAVYHSTGKNNIITILCPHDEPIKKTTFQRINNGSFAGGIVNQNKNVKDYIIESPGDKVERFEDIECKSKFLFFRKSFNEIDNVFVKSSTEFFLYKNGFQSDTPVTLFFKDSKGVIISNGAKLMLTGEVAKSIKFDQDVKIIRANGSQTIVDLPEGSYSFTVKK